MIENFQVESLCQEPSEERECNNSGCKNKRHLRASKRTAHLNDEREFQFVEVPTEGGKQNADDNGEQTNNSGNETPL